VGDALASSKRSGKSSGLLLASYAATYALRRTRHADLLRGEQDEKRASIRVRKVSPDA
jgi:hypothetical protein